MTAGYALAILSLLSLGRRRSDVFSTGYLSGRYGYRAGCSGHVHRKISVTEITTHHLHRTQEKSTMKLRNPRPGGTGSSRGISGTSSASSSPAAAAAVPANLNNVLNNAITAAINDTRADDAPPPEPDSPMGQGDANNNTEEENFEFDEHVQTNEFLRLIREEMTVEGIEKNTRAKSTFETHQNENTRFIVWLFHNYEGLIHNELSRDLHEVIETVDYDDMLKRKYRGKKTVEERKHHYLFQLLRNKVAEFLGTPGSSIKKDTVKFNEFVADHKIYVEYLTKRRKSNGSSQ